MLTQIAVEDKAAAGKGGTVVQRLGVSWHHPLMVAATASGTVLLYDLRSPRTAAASLKPHSSPMARSTSPQAAQVFVMLSMI